MSPPLLEARSIRKSFAGVPALKGVSFDLRAGEVHALVGENGAGKSSLIKVFTGAISADDGVLLLLGKEVFVGDPAKAHALGIAAVHQQPSLFPDLTIAENISWAVETGSLWRTLHWNARRQRARELLKRAGGEFLDPERSVGTLTMPEQQIVEIAKALGANAKILIFDEPTASLTDREVENLFDVIFALRAAGVGIIYISHRLEEISRIADRITVLRDGIHVATRDASEVDQKELIELMVGRSITSVYPKREVPIGSVALEMRHVSCRAAGVHDVSLTVRKGEIIGLAGLVGCGRTQLAETIFGITPADSGTILVNGVAVRILSPVDAIESGIGYVPEDRRQHGVVLEMPIAPNMTMASMRQVARWGLLDQQKESELATRFMEQLTIKAPSSKTLVSELSGGNQQKVALARWLAADPQVLILDEPTQGVDVGAKAEIHGLMVDLASRGLGILIISSELPEILGMCDRIAVMRNGSIRETLERRDADPQNILALALGHKKSAVSDTTGIW